MAVEKLCGTCIWHNSATLACEIDLPVAWEKKRKQTVNEKGEQITEVLEWAWLYPPMKPRQRCSRWNDKL